MVGGQQDVGCGELRGLSSPSQGSVLAERRQLFRPFSGGNQRRPDGTGCNGVDPDALGAKLLGQRLGEGDLGALRHGVVDEPRRRVESLDGGGGDDGCARLEVGHCRPGRPEQGIQVRLEDAVEFLSGKRLKAVAVLLVGRVQHHHVQPAELRQGIRHDPGAELFAAAVARQQQGPLPGLADPRRRVLGVGFLFREIGNRDVGPLAGERNGHGPADPGIPAGDERRLTGERAASLVAFLAVVRLRLHGSRKPGLLLDLLRERPLVVARPGVPRLVVLLVVRHSPPR
ncbi:hypothetical protein D9M72_296990 [compost metagenome]